MKSIFNITALALSLLLMQACGSKTKEATSSVTELTAEEKQAQEKSLADHKRDSIRQEKLRVAAERRAAREEFYKDPTGDVVYNRSEVPPAFPGGNDAMMKYFRENLKYPATAETNGWEGMVYVEFVVGKDGKVRQSVVTDETDEDVDASFKAEALRVVDNMPKWTPGKQLGKPVHVKFNLPVAFQIASN